MKINFDYSDFFNRLSDDTSKKEVQYKPLNEKNDAEPFSVKKQDSLENDSSPTINTQANVQENVEESFRDLSSFNTKNTSYLTVFKQSPPNIEITSENTNIIFDEIPDDEELLAVAGVDTVKNLLSPSDKILQDVIFYLEEVKVEKLTVRPTGQYFFINDVYYVLNDNTHVDKISNIIADLKNMGSIGSLLNKRVNMYKDLENIIIEKNLFKNSKYSLLEFIPNKELSQIISKTFSLLMLENYNSTKINEEGLGTFNYTSTAQVIGTNVLEHFICDVLDKQQNLLNAPDPESLKKSFDDLYNNFKNKSCSKQDYEKFFGIPYGNKNKDETIGLINYLLNFLVKRKLVTEQSLEGKHPLILLNLTYEFDHKAFSLKLGAYILDKLVSIDLLLQSRGQALVNGILCKNIPVISVTDKQCINYIVSASFAKPRLRRIDDVNNNISLVFKDNSGKFVVNLELDERSVRDSYKTSITILPDLDYCLHEASNTPFCVDILGFNQVIDFLNIVFSKNFSSNDEDILTFLSVFYEIDFVTVLKNVTNKVLLEEIMCMGLQLLKMPPLDSKGTLKSKVKDDIVLNTIYNKVYSRKYYLVGLLNELNVYKHFNFFFIPKFLASTGRMFSNCYFLNLQTAKITRTFIQFHNSSKLTSTQFEQVSEIIRKVFSNNNFEFPQLSYEMYTSATVKNSKAFLNSFLTKDFELKTFPYDSSFATQLNYMKNYVKKLKDALYITSLIAKQKFDYNMVYQKDATTSGPALVSLVLQNKTLAEKANIQGQRYHDLYSELNDNFIKQVKNVIAFLNNLIYILFQKTLEEWIKEMTELLPTSNKILVTKDVEEIFSCIFLTPDKVLATTAIKTLVNIFKSSSYNKNSSLEKSYSTIFNLVIPSDFSWLIKKNISKDNRDVYKIFFYNLESLREIFRFYKAINSVPLEALNSRNLHKKEVMTYFYNAGEKARVIDYKKHITEYFTSKGLPATPQHELGDLCEFLNSFFRYIVESLLPGSQCFLRTCKKFISQKTNTGLQPIKIKLRYLVWDFIILQQHSKRMRITAGGSFVGSTFRHKLEVRRFTDKFNRKDMETTFASIFIHSIDAHIVHRFYHLLYLLNIEFEAAGLPRISGFTNHDCYGLNMTYNIYLDSILSFIYNEISASGFNNCIDFKIINEKPFLVTNPSFIRY